MDLCQLAENVLKTQTARIATQYTYITITEFELIRLETFALYIACSGLPYIHSPIREKLSKLSIYILEQIYRSEFGYEYEEYSKYIPSELEINVWIELEFMKSQKK